MLDTETLTLKQISITCKINLDFVFFAKRIGQDYSVHMQLKITRHLLAVHGCKTLAEQLTNFSELGYMPIDVDIKQPDDGDGSEATLMRRHAGWHRTCHLKETEKFGTSSVHTHSSHGSIVTLNLKMTSASFAISQLDLKISTVHLHMTLKSS